MATVKEAVKESLLGSSAPEHLSTESRTTFLRFAKKDGDAADPENSELSMDRDGFIDAIAPETEDYVSALTFAVTCRSCAPHHMSTKH
jgi:solute carrier family 25 (mitochondrial aspartate/glutamate transporter), member 12/13